MTFQEYELKEYDGIMRFITAGNAIFTIRNEKTNNRLTYNFRQCRSNPDLFWVHVLFLPNNQSKSSYRFLGGFTEITGYKHSNHSRIKHDSLSAQVIFWFAEKLISKQLPSYIKVYHTSHCGRCGKLLTTPDSILSGFGPECLKVEIKSGNTQPVKLLEQHQEQLHRHFDQINNQLQFDFV